MEEQRVILVTEPHTDINAGFVVVLGSGHDPPLDIEQIEDQVAKAAGTAQEKIWLDLATEAFASYRAFTLQYLRHYSSPTFLTVEEQGKIFQSGLALSPLAWAHTRYTADWAIAWALIGEWSSRELFPAPLRGGWPKHGHDGKLIDPFKERRPGLVGWARADFEQGALPALIALPRGGEDAGAPCWLNFSGHAYSPWVHEACSGSWIRRGKSWSTCEAPQPLSLWVDHPRSFPIVGTLGLLPQWCKKDSGDSVRLAPGRDVSFRASPCPLSLTEEICLLGLWRRLSPDEEDNPSPARGWLSACNPNYSPEQAYKAYLELKEEGCSELFTLSRAWSVDGYDSGDTTKALLQLSPARLEQMVHTRFQGRQPPWIVDDDWEFHMRVLLDAESQMPPADTRHPAYNGTKQRAVPLPIMVECNGLGGGDLSLEQPWHICIKTNKHRQQIYGPSLALVEETVKLDRSTVHVVALGLTKSLQEFLVLHYYATDSAKSWNALLHDWFPQVKWAPPGQIRCTAKRVYKTVHIAPSHRRAPHPCWTGPMQLLFSLLLGHGRMRYTSLSSRLLSRVICRPVCLTSSLAVSGYPCERCTRCNCLSAPAVGAGP